MTNSFLYYELLSNKRERERAEAKEGKKMNQTENGIYYDIKCEREKRSYPLAS